MSTSSHESPSPSAEAIAEIRARLEQRYALSDPDAIEREMLDDTRVALAAYDAQGRELKEANGRAKLCAQAWETECADHAETAQRLAESEAYIVSLCNARDDAEGRFIHARSKLAEAEAESRLSALTAALTKAQDLMREVYQAHRDKNSADYNECESAPCAWCDGVDEVAVLAAQGHAERQAP